MTWLSLSSGKKCTHAKLYKSLENPVPTMVTLQLCVLGCLYIQVQSVHIRTDVIKPN